MPKEWLAPPWVPGQRPVGRTKGTPNQLTVAHREFCELLITDEEYQVNLLERLRKGKAHPAVETMIWYYARGKPREAIELSGSVQMRDISMMNTEELARELADQQRMIEEFLSRRSEDNDRALALLPGPETHDSDPATDPPETSENTE